MSENGHSFPNNYQHNNDKNNDINGNRKRSLLDNPSTSEKNSKRESGSPGTSSSSPEKIVIKDPSIIAADEARQIITRSQARSDANNENEKVKPSLDPLEKEEETAQTLGLFKKYCDKVEYVKKPLYVSDINNKIWFKAEDITKIFGYSSQTNPLTIINKDNKSKFGDLSLRDEANVLPANINANTVFIDTDGIIVLICNSTKPECKKFLKWSLLSAAKNDIPTEKSQNQIETINNTNLVGNEMREMVSLIKGERDNTATILDVLKTQTETNNMLAKTLCDLKENKSTPPTPSTSGLQNTQQVQQSSVSYSKNNDSSQQGFYILQDRKNPNQYKFFQRQLNSVKSSFNCFINKNGTEYKKIYPSTGNPAISNYPGKAIDKVKEFLSGQDIQCETVKTIMTINTEHEIDLQMYLHKYKVEFEIFFMDYM